MKKSLLFTAMMLFMAVGIASAQMLEVHGTVVDASTGEPVPFAAIQVKGTMTGATTDADGTYAITVDSHAILIFSSVGYISKDVPVAGRIQVDCALDVDATTLEDVVVVAYGSAKREAITGSVTSVQGETLASAPQISVDKSLAGKLAGVQVTQSTGQPGAGSQIRIRGNSSIHASNAPLWVVDGIPIISGDISQSSMRSDMLTTLNPNDIESITVLKDAAAAAVYGSRAAGGVILVTTKSGKSGKAQFDARAKFGISWLQSDTGFRPMVASELLGYHRDAVVNAGLNPDDPTGTFYRPMSLLSGELTNWTSYLMRPGYIQEYEINARGGTDKAKFYSSISYQKNDGIYYGSEYQKFQARVNADFKLNKKLETGVRINMGYTTQNSPFAADLDGGYYSPENPSIASLSILPWTPKYDENGNHNLAISENMNTNPRASALYNQDKLDSYRVNATMFLKWEPVKNLVLETKNSAELVTTSQRQYLSVLAGYEENQLLDGRVQVLQLTTSNTANYANVFGGYHSFRALVGQEAMSYSSVSDQAVSNDVDQEIPYPNTADKSLYEVYKGFGKEAMLSFFGIVDYNYDNRYFVQATLRGDGSSLFGAKNKWGLFWSASASWNISSEKWLADFTALDILKLRASYGVNGNNGIAKYKAYGLYGTVSYNGTNGLLPSQPSNDQLAWEKNATWNIGLDFSFFNRLRGSVDVYERVTKDMLLNKATPYTTGFSSNFMNTGSMKNTGVEFQLDGDVISTEDFFWNIGMNVAYNKNEILDLGGEKTIGSSLQNVVGKSMYTYYVRDYYGVNPSNGEALWVTEDGKLSNDYSKARRYYAGSPEPKVVGGFNTTFSWKGLSLSAFFEFKAGNLVNASEWSLYIDDGNNLNSNKAVSGLNYWKKPGDTGVNPKPVAGNTSNSNALSDRYLQDGSYVRLKDITLSYSLPKKALDKMRIQGLRFYVSGLNLYCFNDVDFWDPEMGVTGSILGTYPLTKSVVGGIEISF